MPLFKSNHPPQAEPNSSVGDPAAASPPEAAQGTAPPSSSDSSSPTFNSGKHTTPSKQVNKQRSPRVAAGSTKKVSLWERWKNVDVLAYFFSPKPPSKFGRTLFIAQPLPEESMALQHKVLLRKGNKEKGKKAWGLGGKKKAVNQEEGWLFATNQVLTSKYNIFTFVPKNLLEQFRRVANVFFLVLVILQFFPIFQNVSPALAAFPLLTVLAITALKDGYEDIKRHESDRRTNGIECLALRTGEEHEGLHLPHLFSHNEEGREVPFNPNHTENKEKKINVPGASWLMSKILINVLNVFAFANLHDFSWGTKDHNLIQTDLGVAVVSGDKTVDVSLPTAQKDIDVTYDDALHKLKTRPKVIEKSQSAVEKETMKQDYYKNVRTNVLLAWALSNGVLAAGVLHGDIASTFAKTGGNTTTRIYMIVILAFVALMSVIRFAGSTVYLAIRLFSG